MTPNRRLLIGLGIVTVWVLMTTALPITAQEGFPTNPPPPNTPALPAFATNTPVPTPFVPEAPFERYALRLWDEATLTNVLLAQIQALTLDDRERQLAIRLLQNELRRRFPSAPSDLERRETLLMTLLNAPRGSVDMRLTVRPYLEAALNELQPAFDSNQSLEYNGFSISITPANLDADGRADAVIGLQYPAGVNDPSALRYSDYTLARVDETGMYRILDGMLPAAPSGDVESLSLERIGDLNGDRLDEVALSLTRSGAVNREMLIFGYRGGMATNLIQPGQTIDYAEIVDWAFSGTTLTAREYQVESLAWGCLGERDVTWTWSANFFRPPVALDNFTFQNHLACLLYGIEPIFEMPIADAINAIERLIPLATPADTDAAQRAALVLAVLQVFNADAGAALTSVQQLDAVAESGSWLKQQTSTFLEAANESNMTPLKLCARLEEASAYGACSVEGALRRIFTEQPFNRDEPIEAQAARLGLVVVDQLTVTEVGRLDRQAVHFDLGVDNWWAFAPTSPTAYTAEKIAPPAGYEATPLPPPIVRTPTNAVDALLLANDPAEALNVLDNAARSNPGVPLDPASRFLAAICYDLLGDRTNARRAYFDLWSAEPESIWGQLAAEHLERR